MKKYIVREGDSMWSISKLTGVRLNLLMAANPQVTDPNKLRPGDVISIPELDKGKPDTAPVTPTAPEAAPGIAPGYFGFVWPHVVRSNETWESISEFYATPVAEIRRMNPNLSQRHLREGDVIYIPAAAPPHTPAPGMPNGMQPGAGMMPNGMQPGTGMMPNGMPTGVGMMPNGMPPGAGMMPNGMPPGAGMMPNGMPPGAGMMPNGLPYDMQPGMGMWPNGMPPGPGMMPHPAYGAQPLPGYGPHTHVPRNAYPGNPAYQGYYPKSLPYPGVPYPYPVYGPYRPAYGYPMTPYANNTMWRQAQQNVPQTWYGDWDESSSWESSWDVDWEDGPSSQKSHPGYRDHFESQESQSIDRQQSDTQRRADDEYGGERA